MRAKDLIVVIKRIVEQTELEEDGGVGGAGGGGMSMGGAPVSMGVSDSGSPTNHTGASIALTYPNRKKKKLKTFTTKDDIDANA